MGKRKYNIKWRQSDFSKLSWAIRKFNNEIDRLSSESPEIKKYLPEKVTYTNIKSIINTRKDFNQEIKSLERFYKPPKNYHNAKPYDIVDIPENTYGLKTTRWQMAEMRRQERKVNKQREKRKEFELSIQQTHRGKKLGYTRAQFGMGPEELRNVEPIKAFTQSQRKSGIDARFRMLRKHSSEMYYEKYDSIYKDNFIKMFSHNYNIKNKRVQNIINYIKKLSPDEFTAVSYSLPGKIFESTNMFKTDLVIDEEEQQGYIELIEENFGIEYTEE